MIFLCKWIISRFHVNFQECESQTCPPQKRVEPLVFPIQHVQHITVGAYIVCYLKQTQHLHPYANLQKFPTHSFQTAFFPPPKIIQNRTQNRAPYRLWSLQWLSPRRGWPEWSWGAVGVARPDAVVGSSGKLQVGVSKNRATPKWMVDNGKPLLKWMIWGYHYFRKHSSGEGKLQPNSLAQQKPS